VPFAVELLPGFQVDGIWNVPTTLTFAGCVQPNQAWFFKNGNCPISFALSN